jgi:DNA polymerase-2
LEIEFEKHYHKFVLTAMRGKEFGAKKRYAGLYLKGGREEIEFVGMEFVRSDWTKLAKTFQEQLYNRLFNNLEIILWIREFIRNLLNGNYDEYLIYKKRLRKRTDAYTKSSPPHVKAARLINQERGIVNYVITKRGPIPITLMHKDYDYQHYIEKQLKPIADSVLPFFNYSFDNIVKSNQMELF